MAWPATATTDEFTPSFISTNSNTFLPVLMDL